MRCLQEICEASQEICEASNLGFNQHWSEVASIYRHQRSINFNPQLSKIKVRRDHSDMDHDDDRPGDRVDHQGGHHNDLRDRHGFSLALVHSPLVEGIVLGIALKGAFLNYEAHLGVNYLVLHLILIPPKKFG